MRSYKSGASRAAFIALGGLLASAALVQVLARRAEKAHRPLGKILRVRGRAVHAVERGTGPCGFAPRQRPKGRRRSRGSFRFCQATA